MNPTREHLLGYLLGALDRAEQDEVESQLDQDPELREELRRLEACVGRLGLDAAPHDYEPPAGLATRTCRFVAAHAEAVITTRAALVPYGEVAARRFAWSDLVVAAAVLIVAASLFFPAVSHSRTHAQMAGCQNHLRLIGVGYHEHANVDPHDSFPAPAPSGNRGVAGVVPVHLAHGGFVTTPDVFLCPSTWRKWRDEPYYLPTVEELDTAGDPVLAILHRTMGGDYGYVMGYIENGRLQKVCNSRRSHYPIVSDAPSPTNPERLSDNHGNLGQNFLFEDGHVKLIRDLSSPHLPDHPFFNREGEVAAGSNCDDPVLGGSPDRPIPLAR